MLDSSKNVISGFGVCENYERFLLKRFLCWDCLRCWGRTGAGKVRENRMGGFSNNRFVLKPDVAIASEVSILSKNSLAITDFHAKQTQHVQLTLMTLSC